jgi:hypothetical protein
MTYLSGVLEPPQIKRASASTGMEEWLLSPNTPLRESYGIKVKIIFF